MGGRRQLAMRGRALLALVLAALTAGPALGGRVCPPADMAQPLPGVAEARLHQASVSTAAFPGAWQTGVIGPQKLDYRLFVDGSGSVGDDARLRGWRVDFQCDLAAGTCKITGQDNPPEAAYAAAKAIADCLVDAPPKPRKRPEGAFAKAKPASKPGKETKSETPPAEEARTQPAPQTPAQGAATPAEEVAVSKAAPAQPAPGKDAAQPATEGSAQGAATPDEVSAAMQAGPAEAIPARDRAQPSLPA